MLTGAVIGLFALWLLLSLLAQLQLRPIRPLLRHDVFSLLPVWTFFAPRPASFDFHLQYRHLLPDGSPSAWREVLPCRERRLREAWWNPERRCRKVLDAALRPLLQSRPAGAKSPADTRAYRILLGYVAALPREAGAAAVEFRILRSDGWLAETPPRLVFRSESHPLADGGEARSAA